jgi:two-component system, LytTR family, response regulator
MDKIRVLIVDDEDPARLRLRKLLAREPDVELAGEGHDGRDAFEMIRLLEPHLVFLDVQMKQMGGLELVSHLPKESRPFIILVTAHDQYALNAFETDILDYLLKPFTDERFQAALNRARTRIRQHHIHLHTEKLLSLLNDRPLAPVAASESSISPSTSNLAPLDRLVLKSGSHLVFIDPAQVDWFEAEGVYVRVHVDKKTHLLRDSLTNIEQRLDPRRFVRIHRSTIVNLDRIREVMPHENGGSIVVLKDGKQLRMSRSYRDRLSPTLG